jgi:hypothetical protein
VNRIRLGPSVKYWGAQSASEEEIESARDQYADDSCDIDDDALVSSSWRDNGGTGGYWIQAWLWIDPEEEDPGNFEISTE